MGNQKPLTATVLEIQRMSTEDGPGIRTTVFFKGCTLACTWCHNPESISPKPQSHWVAGRCLGCLMCVETCENKALSANEERIEIDRERCVGCGACAEECPSTAMEMWGKFWALDNLVTEVIKDRAYFETGGGGITVSGGEPAMQGEFVTEFLKRLQSLGIHTALDTCGQVSQSVLGKILPYCDMILFDLKEIDSQKHKQFTAHGNERITDNLCFIVKQMKKHGTPKTLWIRTPMIPGTTATSENVEGIGRFIAQNADGVCSRWELCAFNNLCQDKYLQLGKVWQFQPCSLLDENRAAALFETAKRSGVDPKIVFRSGSTHEKAAEKKEIPKLVLVKESRSQ